MTNRVTASSQIHGFEDGFWPLADSHAIFVRNLRFLLGKREMKPAELARRLGKNQSAISQWFADISSPDMKTVGRIADILDVPVRDLFDDPDDVRPPISRPPINEAERALKVLAEKVGLRIRIDRLNK